MTEQTSAADARVSVPATQSSWSRWLGGTVLAGLVLTPLIHALPPRWKLLGLNAWILAALVGYISGRLSSVGGMVSQLVQRCVTILCVVGAVVLLSAWGLRDLRQQTQLKMPPLPQQSASSPEGFARALQTQEALREYMQPTMTDYQRLRFHRLSPLNRIRPWALWSGELLIAALVATWTFGAGRADAALEPSSLDAGPTRP